MTLLHFFFKTKISQSYFWSHTSVMGLSVEASGFHLTLLRIMTPLHIHSLRQ